MGPPGVVVKGMYDEGGEGVSTFQKSNGVMNELISGGLARHWGIGGILYYAPCRI